MKTKIMLAIAVLTAIALFNINPPSEAQTASAQPMTPEQLNQHTTY